MAEERVKGRVFRCDCGWPYHSLHVGPFGSAEAMETWELDHPAVTITVVAGGPGEGYGWRTRIAAAWALLRGPVHPLTEVIIHREEWPEFVAHVKAIDAASAAEQARRLAFGIERHGKPAPSETRLTDND